MGIYIDLEHDFIERTLNLIEQYENVLNDFPFAEQYNYTLLINCLTGLIVMPKERSINAIPNESLSLEMRNDMGLIHTIIDPRCKTLRSLIKKLRNCVAHFTIEVKSDHDGVNIAEIIFYDNYKKPRYDVAVLRPQSFCHL